MRREEIELERLEKKLDEYDEADDDEDDGEDEDNNEFSQLQQLLSFLGVQLPGAAGNAAMPLTSPGNAPGSAAQPGQPPAPVSTPGIQGQIENYANQLHYVLKFKGEVKKHLANMPQEKRSRLVDDLNDLADVVMELDETPAQESEGDVSYG